MMTDSPASPTSPGRTAAEDQRGTAEPVLEGWLMKRGAKRKNWKVRWFEKRSDKFVYSTAKDKTDKGFISLPDILSVSVRTESQQPLPRKTSSLISLKRDRDSKEKIESGDGSPLVHKRLEKGAAQIPGNDSGELTSSRSSSVDTQSADDDTDDDEEEMEMDKKKRAQYDKGFQIETEKRIYFLLAPSEKEREKWIKGIEYHIRKLRDKEQAAERLLKVEEALRQAQQSTRLDKEEMERIYHQRELEIEAQWKKREQELLEKYKRKKRQTRKKLREKEREISDVAFAGQLLVANQQTNAQEPPRTPSEIEQSLREMVETLQSKLSENEELIQYQKNIITDLEKAKSANERLVKEAEKKKKKVEREYQRTIKREIRFKAALAFRSPPEIHVTAGSTQDEESEGTECSSEADETPSESTEDFKKEEWDEDEEDELDIEDSQQRESSEGDILTEEMSSTDTENNNDGSDEHLGAAPSDDYESLQGEASQTKLEYQKNTLTEITRRHTSMNEAKESSDHLATQSFSRETHPHSKTLSFPDRTQPDILHSSLSAVTESPSQLSLSCALPKTKPPVPPRRRMEKWTRGQTDELKRKTKDPDDSALKDRPDRKKRISLVKKLQQQQQPVSLIKSMVITSTSLPTAPFSGLSSRAEGNIASPGQQITLKLICPDLSIKTKSIRVDVNTTTNSLLKRRPLVNWLKKLQIKKSKDRQEKLIYALFVPISTPLSLPSFSPAAGRKADVLLRGIWLHEESPLWRYDLDEGALVELRCIEAAKHASDVGNYYVLQILYSTNNVPNAADDTLPTARDSQLFKFNKYTTVRDVMTTVGFKLDTGCDVEHYGLLLHKQVGTMWLNPDNILAAYRLQNMDILELKKRYLELCLEEANAPTVPASGVAKDRLLLDPFSVSVIDATHSVCNWLGIAQSRWKHYGILASTPPEPPVWLREGQTLAYYALTTAAIIELQPKSVFNEVPENIDSTTYTLIIKFSPHNSNQPEDMANEATSTPTAPMKRQEEVDSSLARYLIGGEVGRQHLEGVGLVMPNQLVVGTIYCTNYAVMFHPRLLAAESIRVPLYAIWRISKVAKATLMIHFKDFRQNIRFRFSSKNLARHWLNILYQNAFPVQIQKTFAFDFKWEGLNSGWQIYNVNDEYKRQFSLAGKMGERWRLSDINKDWRKAPTYPEYIGVPSEATDEALHPVFEFRSKGRIPALSYLFRNGASITRSSQPMVGFRGNSCPQDEALLEAIFRTNPTSDRKSSVLRIYDARPRVNAMANQAMGAGVEKCGPNCRLDFLGIGNIHVMRESYNKLNQLCIFDTSSLVNSPNSSSTSSPSFSPLPTPGAPSPLSASWLSNLERTKWMDHLSLILTAAKNVAQCVYKQTSVLIHCSDGWDRTPQLTALAQLMLDKYYRSLRGFAVLIEKEFLSFGHKFQERYGHAHPDDTGTSQRAPIFPQFLDIVYQLTIQFPCAFEFNERFLIFLLEHLYDCQFGTFLCNSQSERKKLRLPEKTIAIWSFILDKNHKKFDFVNPFYMAEIDVLLPDTGVESLVVWKGYYFRHTATLGDDDDALITRYAKKVTVELRAMQMLNTIESLNERLMTKTDPVPAPTNKEASS